MATAVEAQIAGSLWKIEKAVGDVEGAATDEEVEKQLRGLGYIE